MSTWASFKGFGGKLDSTVLNFGVNSDGKVDAKAAILALTQWLHGCRSSPTDYGIPADKVHDVVKVLDKFFPEPDKDQLILPLRLSTDTGSLGSPRRMVPVEVKFGPKNSTIPIADAPNALAYLFSVATPAVSSPTFDSYYLPLTVCFSWFIYLAFLIPITSATTTITNVPVEVGVIYMPSPSANPLFCLGSKWSGADPADGHGAGLVESNELAFDRWLLEEYTKPALARNPSSHLPRWPPRVRTKAARRLNEYILGNPDADPTTTPFLVPLISNLPLPTGNVGLTEFLQGLCAAIIIETKQAGLLVPPDDLISDPRLAPKLMDLLYAVFDASGDLSNPTTLLQSVSALLEFYLTPHIFNPISGKELPLGSSQAIVTALSKSLPFALLPVMVKKLQSLHAHLRHLYESDDNHVRYIATAIFWIYTEEMYGRGWEAFPVHAL
ncbi:uncharacterized protein Z520_10073, partial [Fonsecaea multimorphosa CBS 102226]